MPEITFDSPAANAECAPPASQERISPVSGLMEGVVPTMTFTQQSIAECSAESSVLVTFFSLSNSARKPKEDRLVVLAEFLRQDDGGFAVNFPAFPAACTEGASFDEALEMAKECIVGFLKAGGTEAPPPGEFLATENDFVMTISINMDEIRKPEAA